MGQTVEIRVPDIGDFEDVEVVEILVSAGDEVAIDDPLVSVESDKATMEIPSTEAGVVSEVRVAEGDRVSEGSVLIVLDAAAEAAAARPVAATPEPVTTAPAETPPAPAMPDATSAPSHEAATPVETRPVQASTPVETPPVPATTPVETPPVQATAPPRRASAPDPIPDREGLPHASPLVRRYARQLGVPLESTEGTGPHGRVLADDLRRRVRDRFATDRDPAEGPARPATGVPPIPDVDHAAFGPVHEEPLTRIQRVAGPALHRSWLNVPHVTQHDEADITDLERFRRDRRESAEARGVRLSPLLFVMKAVCHVLREFPKFRSSLAPEGDRLIVKDSLHLGVAVDTDQGLVVPVVRDVDRKGVFELAAEVSEIADRARARKLGPADLAGAVFTISSLGGIGGTAFSPIVNAPEVAILGVSKTSVRPRWTGPDPIDWNPETPSESGSAQFEPRLVLPFSLSYDHRVIDGADAVRFTTRLGHVLEDPRRLLL